MNTTKAVPNPKEQLENCTFVKTVAMLSIVLFHSILFWRGNWGAVPVTPALESRGLYWLQSWLASFGNYAFILVSGYLFHFTRFEKNSYSGFWPFVFNKGKRLLIPFVAVGILWVIPISIFYLKLDAFEVIKDFILVTEAGQLWFLVMLFGVFVLAWIFSPLWGKSPVLGLVSVLVLYVLSLVLPRFLPGPFRVWEACQYLLIFYIGFSLRRSASKAVLFRIPWFVYLLVNVALVVVTQIPLPSAFPLSFVFQPVLKTVSQIAGALMAFVVLQKIGCRLSWKENRGFAYLSRFAMPIYLFHQQFIYFSIMAFNGKINPYLHACLNFAVAMIFSGILAWICLKFPLTRLLIGEKIKKR